MNLASCDGCGVVLDKDKLNFPDPNDFLLEGGGVDDSLVVWVGADPIAFTACPICGAKILEH